MFCFIFAGGGIIPLDVLDSGSEIIWPHWVLFASIGFLVHWFVIVFWN